MGDRSWVQALILYLKKYLFIYLHVFNGAMLLECIQNTPWTSLTLTSCPHVITKVIQDYNLRLQLVLFLTAHLAFSINDTFAKTEKKKHNRRHFLWQLTEFNLPKTLMLHFYTSILTSSITICYSEATAKDKGRLQSAISPGPVHLQDPEACRWIRGKPMGGVY